mmetsp:Transcript_8165/g.36147  ORF Transcript_8165/g.36147 Transcript_8165/m.36147 type:complete len:100 (+) Transcript_8165:2786-3085(+)
MIPPPLVGVADPPSLAALELLWKARALRCLDLARMVFHIRVAHASSPFDPPGKSLICLRPDARSGATAVSALLGTAARPHGLAVALATALAAFLNDIQN